MPRKEGGKELKVLMSADDLAKVHALARLREFGITADYIRFLLEQDAAELGIPLDFDIDRGGYRGAKPDL